MKEQISKYKNTMEFIFFAKYGIPPSYAKMWIEKYDFNGMLKKCDHVALHDDPAIWVDAIYEWATKNKEAL